MIQVSCNIFYFLLYYITLINIIGHRNVIIILKFQVNVLAESNGTNKGELGFLPVKVTSDPEGKHPLC